MENIPSIIHMVDNTNWQMICWCNFRERRILKQVNRKQIHGENFIGDSGKVIGSMNSTGTRLSTLLRIQIYALETIDNEWYGYRQMKVEKEMRDNKEKEMGKTVKKTSCANIRWPWSKPIDNSLERLKEHSAGEVASE